MKNTFWKRERIEIMIALALFNYVFLGAEYLFDKHTSLIFSTGAYSLSGKTSLLNPDARTVWGIPIKAGLRYYLGNFYFGGDAGYLNQSGFEPNNGFAYILIIA